MRELRFHAIEETRRVVSSSAEESTFHDRRIALTSDGINFLNGDWLEWLPLVIQLLELLNEWLQETKTGSGTRVLEQSCRELPDWDYLQDFLAKVKEEVRNG